MAIHGVIKPDSGTLHIHTTTPTQAEKLAGQILDDSVSVSASDLSDLDLKAKTPQYPEGVTHLRFHETAQSALEDTVALRERQDELAERAQETASPEFRTTLEDEFDALTIEISRILEVASYNGKSILSADTFAITDQQNDYYAVSGTPGFGLLLVPGTRQLVLGSRSAAAANFFTIENAETTQENLEPYEQIARLFLSATESEVEQSEKNLIRNPDVSKVQVSQSNQTLTSFGEAEKAAESVYKQIIDLAIQDEGAGQELAFHKQELDASKIFLLLDGS